MPSAEIPTIAATPLAGIRVVDLGRIFAGPFCAQLLGDLGADVIKVEGAEGDALRRSQPSFAPDIGGYFSTANRNKRSLRIDLRKPGAKTILSALLARADVLVENFRPGVLEAMGLDEATLQREFPRLVVARVSAYGNAGPDRDLPGVDQMIQGVSGFMSITGTPDTGPIRAGIAIADAIAGYAACVGVLAALNERHQSGRGQIVRTSLLEALMGTMSVQAGKYFASGIDPVPEGNFHPVTAVYGAFATADGFVQMYVSEDHRMEKLARLCGKPEWLDDPRLHPQKARDRNRDYARGVVAEVMKTRTTAEWIAALKAADIPCGPILSVAEAFAAPQAQAMGMVLESALPDGTTLRLPGFPVKLARTPPSLRRAPPHLGEHNDDVLAELGLADDAGARDALAGGGNPKA
ncbi:MAG: CoA transferase [Rhodospirillaceae bacterium]|nr:CoA transferase [Rhodospirillaceae bacterium]